jgi:hypothetical protein
LDIEEADAAVREDGHLSEFLEAAASIMLSHDMERRFGIALLHRHNRCLPGERMIQRTEVFDGEDALVARPVTTSEQSDKPTPCVWTIGERYFIHLNTQWISWHLNCFGATKHRMNFFHLFGSWQRRLQSAI